MVDMLGNVRIIANPLAPDIFVDDAVSIEEANGVVRVTLAVAKMETPVSPAPTNLVVVGRLIMGEESARRLAMNLLTYFQGKGVNLEDIAPLGRACPKGSA